MFGETLEEFGPVAPVRKKRAPFHASISAEGHAAMLKAVQEEIRRLVDAEDFGVKQLAAIAFLAEQTRSMLKDLAVQIEEEGEQLEKANGDLGNMGEFGQTGSIAPASPVETYGAGLMRQLVPMITQLLQQNRKVKSAPRLQDMVAGAAQAREAGMDDLADHMMSVVKKTCDQAFEDEATDLPVEVEVQAAEQPKSDGGDDAVVLS